MLCRQARGPARRIVAIAEGALRGGTAPPFAALRRNPNFQWQRLLPIAAFRSYANGRPHPPGGTHRMDMSGEEKKSALEEYGVDLTARAKAGKLDPVIGRDAEIHRTIQVLSRRTKNNPVLIGSAGTGKVRNSTSYCL